MGEAPVTEDGTVTRSAEVTQEMGFYIYIGVFLCVSLCVCVFPPLNLCLTVKYVGSFPVDDHCLDDQIEQLHTQLKTLKVSLGLK